MIQIICRAHDRRLEAGHNARVHQAWNTAALTRVDRMPALSTLLMDRASRPRQSIRDHRAIIRAMAGVSDRPKAA
jgi:hypothetical protein